MESNLLNRVFMSTEGFPGSSFGVRNKKKSAKMSVIKSINWFKVELNVIFTSTVDGKILRWEPGFLEINSFFDFKCFFWKDVCWKLDPFGIWCRKLLSCDPILERMMSSEPCPYIHISYNSKYIIVINHIYYIYILGSQTNHQVVQVFSHQKILLLPKPGL